MNGGLGKEVEDLLKDAIDLFIPEIICMAWQPQHHPLSTSAKSQAPASRVWKLWEIMLLITSENGRKEDGREGGMKRKTVERWGGGERRRRESRMIEARKNRKTESNFGDPQRRRISSQQARQKRWSTRRSEGLLGRRCGSSGGTGASESGGGNMKSCF